jgi:hypothetical protein
MKPASEKSLYPHVKSFRVNDRQQEALTELRGERSEGEFLRALLDSVATGTTPLPADPVVVAVEVRLHRIAAFLIAWQADLELSEAEKIVASVLGSDAGGPST